MALASFLFVCFTGVCVCSAASRTTARAMSEVQMSVTQKGLNFANNILVNKVVQEIQGLRIPLVKRSSLTLYNSAVRTAKINSSSLSIDSYYGALVLDLKLDLLQIAGKYYISSWIGSGGGTYNVKLKQVRIVKYLAVDRDADGKPVVRTKSCFTQIAGGSEMKFRGKFQFVFNALMAIIKKTFEREIEKLICTSVTSAINEKSTGITKSYPVHQRIPRLNCSTIGFTLSKAPMVKRQRVELLLQANVTSCYSLATPSRRRRRVAYRLLARQDKMLHISIGDDLLNSLMDLYYKAGKLNRTFTIDKQNTLSVQFSTPPVFATTPRGTTVTAMAVATVTNVVAKGNQSHATTVNLVIGGAVTISEDNRRLSAMITNLSITPFVSTKSRSYFDMAVRKKVRSLIARKMNALLRRCVPIPLLKGMKLNNNKVTFTKGSIVLSSDITV